MNRYSLLFFILAALLFSTPSLVSAKQQKKAATHPCTAKALEQAKKLLEFHNGPDDRIEIDKNVKVLPPLKNPAGKGSFDVLEVWGYIYKGQYRMRFLFAALPKPNTCLLMGQEILEHAAL